MVKIPLDEKLLPDLNESSILIVCAVLIFLIFSLDVSLAIGFVVSILYVIPVLICIWSPRRRTIFIVAAVSSILTLAAIPLKPPGDILLPLFNRPLSLAALWTVTVLVDRFSTERANAEKERGTTIEFLRLVNESDLTEELIHSATEFFQKQSGCEAVGIRLKEGADYPYYETKGFPPEFVRLETHLCDHDKRGGIVLDGDGSPILECMCGNVIQGRTDPSKPFFTAKGSFWTNSTTELLATTTEEDRRARTRNRCNGEGYESVALIPLRVGGETFGLLQLNDRRKGIYSIRIIEQWERLAGYLAVALARLRTEEDLRESEAKYRDLFETVQEVFYIDQLIYDEHGSVIDWIFDDLNPAGLKLLGLNDINEAKGKRGSEILGPKAASFYLPMIEEARRSNKATTFQYESPSEDKEFLTSYVVRGDRLISAQMDITDIKRAQRQADEYSKELERSNEELKQFAYVASHDLQEPLRMVTAYLGLLERKYGDRLDGKAKEYIDFAVEGGLRARDLIRDLLDFSRIDSQAQEFLETNMEEVLGIAISNLSVRIKEEGASVSHDPLPTILADNSQMLQLMQNLVANAIKFHGAEPPEVHVSCADIGPEWLFSVHDNGIGIDPQYRDKIFVLFQRLHDRNEYEGTGIGLAISKKIVERHGGSIWFDSPPGSGTIFYFTIPKEPGRWKGNS